MESPKFNINKTKNRYPSASIKAIFIGIMMVILVLSLTSCRGDSSSVTTDNNVTQNQNEDSQLIDEREETVSKNDMSKESSATNNCKAYYDAQNSANNSGLKIGDTFILGNYEILSEDWDSAYTPRTSVDSFKMVSLEWRILDINGSEAVAIPIHVLRRGPVPFDDNGIEKRLNKELTWENASVREWLNNDFYNSVFSESEKKVILTTPLKNNGVEDHGNVSCPDTFDNVWLLSYEEVLKYMPNPNDRTSFTFYGDAEVNASGFCTRTVTIDTGANYIVSVWCADVMNGEIWFTGDPTSEMQGLLPAISVDLNKL